MLIVFEEGSLSEQSFRLGGPNTWSNPGKATRQREFIVHLDSAEPSVTQDPLNLRRFQQSDGGSQARRYFRS